uniref:Uncharacterized protein n=1 Tax=Cacopsylla melanoneura TaxID=428564 RepID=A0A8D8RLJ4_9HEMI
MTCTFTVICSHLQMVVQWMTCTVTVGTVTVGICRGVHGFVCDGNIAVDFGDELTIFINHSFEFGLCISKKPPHECDGGSEVFILMRGFPHIRGPGLLPV